MSVAIVCMVKEVKDVQDSSNASVAGNFSVIQDDSCVLESQDQLNDVSHSRSVVVLFIYI